MRQVGPLDVLHRDVVRIAGQAQVVNGDDIGVRQDGRRLRLALEPLDCLGILAEPLLADQLQRDDTVEQVVPGLEHLPHAALAQRLEQDVGTEHEVFRAGFAEDLLELIRGEQLPPDQALGGDFGVGEVLFHVRGGDLELRRREDVLFPEQGNQFGHG